MMQMRTLGRTGLKVSVAGLGCGGPSRLGTARGATEEQAADIVRLAIELGVNYIDTAESYGTERAVGLAVAGRRDRVILSSKSGLGNKEGLRNGAELIRSLDSSLAKLGTDHLDVYHLHGVSSAQLEHAQNVAISALLEAKRGGKIRHLAVSEQFERDTNHQMLQTLLSGPMAEQIDVVMVGFNLLNPSARTRVFPATRNQNIGTEVMFAVRRALSQPQKLRETLEKLVATGALEGAKIDQDRPLAFLLDEAESLTEAAYRFCAHEPGVDVVLFGTGDPEHLKQNLRSLDRPPLSENASRRLRDLFGTIDSVSGS